VDRKGTFRLMYSTPVQYPDLEEFANKNIQTI